MNVGVGLPTTTPGTTGELLLDWARRADEGPFSSLGVLDRIVYDSLEPFAALAAAAGVTSRVRLATMIAIGPLRPTGLLAKQAGVGARALGRAVDARPRGRSPDWRTTKRRAWNRAAVGESSPSSSRTSAAAWTETAIGPARDGMELLAGGMSGQAFSRMARYTDGYAHGGGPPRAFASAAARAKAAWADLGRPGQPRLWGQGYFCFGDAGRGAEYLRDYYAFTGPFAERIAAENLTSARAVKDFVRGYEEAGCDELVLFPTVADPEELNRLAEAIA